MSRISSEDQLNFVLRCVKHSVNGKVDFGAVAQECGIVSKGAAAKRYERLLKSLGDTPDTPSGDVSVTASPAETPKKGGAKGKPRAPRTPAKGKAAAKTDTPQKRKNGKASAPATPNKKIKSEEKVQDSDSDDMEVKKEIMGGDGDGNAGADANVGVFGTPLRSDNDPFLSQASRESEYDTLFKQFCNTGTSSDETVVKGEDEDVKDEGAEDSEDIPLAILRARDDFQA